MSKLKQQLTAVKQSNKSAFMMHVVAGFPDMCSSELIAKKILESGADILEIQIPFSDPIADGPVIASASEESLKHGTSVADYLNLIDKITKATHKPILIMTYFNIVHKYGVKKFCKKAKSIGVAGLIIPDFPFDEETGDQLIDECRKNKLVFIQFVSSTTRSDRMKEIMKHANGFVYCVARAGTTGKKTDINKDVVDYLKNVRKHTKLPIAVGFGISDKKQVDQLSLYADIMIVGSALIKEYAGKSVEDGLIAIGRFMKRLIG